MKFLVAVGLLSACSSKPDPVIEAVPTKPTAPVVAIAKPGTELAKVAALVPSGMETITRFGARGPIVDMLGSLADSASTTGRPPCWGALVPKLTDMISFANVHTKRSVTVLTGDLPRKDVEACVAQVFAKDPYVVKVGADGDLATFTMADGEPIYAAWKDGMIVAGDKQIVTDVLTAARAAEPWAARLAALPATFQMMEMASIDPIATRLFGVTTTGYDVIGITERPAKAHVVIHATSAADAAMIVQKLATNTVAWGVVMPAAFGEAIKKTPAAVNGTDVDVAIEQANFAAVDAVDLAKLGRAITGAE